MSRIHPSSSVALLPQFALWHVPPTQESVERDIEYEVRPISTFSSSTPIRFEVRSPANEYVLFSESLFWIRLKITLTHSTKSTFDINDWSNMKLSRNLMHSLSPNGFLVNQWQTGYPLALSLRIQSIFRDAFGVL